MHGNVWEWVQDRYEAQRVSEAGALLRWILQGPAAGVEPGLPWWRLEPHRAASLSVGEPLLATPPDYRSANLGFRLLRMVPIA